MIEQRRLRRSAAPRMAMIAALLLAGPASLAIAQQPGPPQGNGKTLPPPAAANAPVAPGPIGTWIDHTGRGAIAIEPCKPGHEGLCGRIVWMQQPLDKGGLPLRDKLNENRRLRERPLCGLQIIGDLKPMRDGSWDRGWIYDPEQGESFDVELRLREPNVLQVKGYKGLKFLSETFQWKRAEAPLTPACPPPPAAPGPA